MGKLDGKVAVITGGSSGMALSTAKLFVEEGARVVVADVNDESGVALAEQLGPSAVFAHTDVGDVPVSRRHARELRERLLDAATKGAFE